MELSDKKNINPNIWGPIFWDTLHLTAFGYPSNPNNKDKQVYMDFIKNYARILPCDKCTRDAQEYVEKLSQLKWNDILKSRESLIEWTWVFHDSVNIKLNKSSPPMKTFKDTFIKSKTSNSSKTGNSWKTFFNRALIFIILIGIALFYARYLRTAR